MEFKWRKSYDGLSFEVLDSGGDYLCGGYVIDHSTKEAKERDSQRHTTQIDAAYFVYFSGGNTSDFTTKLEKLGISHKSCGGCINVCLNKEHSSPYMMAPEISIHELKDIIEEFCCESQCFDYDAELKAFKEKLDKRKAIMDEAKEYLVEKERVREGYAQDIIEAEAQECLEIAELYEQE